LRCDGRSSVIRSTEPSRLVVSEPSAAVESRS
jgi:hypothetical protein